MTEGFGCRSGLVYHAGMVCHAPSAVKSSRTAPPIRGSIPDKNTDEERESPRSGRRDSYFNPTIVGGRAVRGTPTGGLHHPVPRNADSSPAQRIDILGGQSGFVEVLNLPKTALADARLRRKAAKPRRRRLAQRARG